MTTVIALSPLPQSNNLPEVIEAMRALGAPTLRAVRQGEYLLLIEGTHRLEAAIALGLEVEIEEVDVDDVVEHDLQDYPSPCRAGDLVSDDEYYFRSFVGARIFDV